MLRLPLVYHVGFSIKGDGEDGDGEDGDGDDEDDSDGDGEDGGGEDNGFDCSVYSWPSFNQERNQVIIGDWQKQLSKPAKGRAGIAWAKKIEHMFEK